MTLTRTVVFAVITGPNRSVALDSAYYECLRELSKGVTAAARHVSLLPVAVRVSDDKCVAVALPQLRLDNALQHLTLETSTVASQDALPLHDDVLDPEDEDAPVQQVLDIVLVVHVLRVELLEDLHKQVVVHLDKLVILLLLLLLGRQLLVRQLAGLGNRVVVVRDVPRQGEHARLSRLRAVGVVDGVALSVEQGLLDLPEARGLLVLPAELGDLLLLLDLLVGDVLRLVLLLLLLLPLVEGLPAEDELGDLVDDDRDGRRDRFYSGKRNTPVDRVQRLLLEIRDEFLYVLRDEVELRVDVPEEVVDEGDPEDPERRAELDLRRLHRLHVRRRQRVQEVVEGEFAGQRVDLEGCSSALDASRHYISLGQHMCCRGTHATYVLQKARFASRAADDSAYPPIPHRGI